MQATSDSWNCHFCLLDSWHPICPNWSLIAFCIARDCRADR
uniref:Uncharacterized protein n=1 Tax=Arundo donax TaxID=35708 RepID=A0A0A9GWW8_ARUDO